MAGRIGSELAASQILMLLFTCTMGLSLAIKFSSFVELAPFFGAPNLGLQNSVFKEMKAASFATCVRDCQLDTKCHSVNYRRYTSLCEMNEANRIQFPNDFEKMQETVYFDRNMDTLLLSLPGNTTCMTLLRAGVKTSGIYILTVAQRLVQAYCDMTTDGGGWVVFQRRQDGSVDFYRNWTDYQVGFGDLAGEFWLGNDVIRDLTEFSCPWKLHIDLEDWDGSTAWAEYDFQLEGDLYTLRISSYNGTAGDSLAHNNGWAFSTKDQDHDYPEKSCAQLYRGAWWFFWCHEGNLNGVYHHSRRANQFNGITWKAWSGENVSLKKCRMMIREVK